MKQSNWKLLAPICLPGIPKPEAQREAGYYGTLLVFTRLTVGEVEGYKEWPSLKQMRTNKARVKLLADKSEAWVQPLGLMW